jgi:hypothetical protein
MKLTEKTEKLNINDAKTLNKIISELRLTLLAETEGIAASIITDKKYTIEKLLDI